MESEIAVNLISSLVRVAKDQLSSPTSPLENHGVPPLQFQIAPILYEGSDSFGHLAIGTVINMQLPNCTSTGLWNVPPHFSIGDYRRELAVLKIVQSLS
jgi:hypothetical protein